MRMVATSGALAALTLTSGCILTGIDPADLGAKAGEMSAMMTEAGPATSEADMPNGGQATYDGFASFYLEDGPDADEPPVNGTAILGDAHLTVDFDARTVGGVMDDFEVAEFLIADLDDDSFQNLENWEPATGQVVLANGAFTNNTRFTADLLGDLTTTQHVYTLDGDVWGLFRGPNGEYILARGDRGFGKDVAIDGETPLDASFELVAVDE